MQKSDLVEKIAEEAGISKAAADRALDSVLSNLAKALKKGDRVSLVGFGTFSVSKRSARMGRNPQTGETIKIKATKIPRFSAGKSLKDVVASHEQAPTAKGPSATILRRFAKFYLPR